MFDFTDVSAANPLRPLDWRWKLAEMCVEGSIQAAVARSDPDVRLAIRFINNWNWVGDGTGSWLQAKQFPALFPAWHVYARNSLQQLRHELEARLLGREALGDLAHKMNLSEAVLETYERTFFDVRDRITNSSLIGQLIQAHAANTAPSDWPHQVGWKILGYEFGPTMLDCLTVEPPLDKPRSGDDLHRRATIQIQRRATAKALLATISPHTAESNKQQILTNYFKSLQQAKAAGIAIEDTNKLEAAAVEFMAKVPWRCGLTTGVQNISIDELEKNGAVLRAHEQLLVGTGSIPAGLKELMESCVFPEKEPKTAGTT